MSSIAESIIEQYKQRQKKIEADTDALDKELKKKRIEKEKIRDDTLNELAKKRKILDAMKADYGELKTEIEQKAKADLELSSGIAGKVAKGETSIRAYYEAGLNMNEVEKKTREESRAKLESAAKLIRNLWTEIIRLERVEAEARSFIHRYMIAPAEGQVKKLQSEIELLRVGIGVALEGLNPAWADLEKTKQNVALCEGKFALGGMVWKNLSFSELQDIRLDPRLSDPFLESLERIIVEVGDFNPDQRTDLFLSSGLQRGSGLNELSFRQTIREGAFLETSKAASHKPKGTEEK
jgi:DNA repair exonuclease SbcCD ATPase subunit